MTLNVSIDQRRFTTALNAMYASKRAGGIDLPHEMHNHCVRYCDSRADQFADGVDVGVSGEVLPTNADENYFMKHGLNSVTNWVMIVA